MGKRFDLQGLRAVAILQVLGFHFTYGLLPNGYIGVDCFFVLSGYFMSSVLHKKFSSLQEFIATFYIARIKRILPAYFAIIFVGMGLITLAYPRTNFEMNRRSAIQSLNLMRNVGAMNKGFVYSDMLMIGQDFFTHLWSLCVELHFYILVPFFFMMEVSLGRKNSFIGLFAIGAASLVFYFVNPEEVAFNHVFARVWQFVVGYLVFFFDPTALPRERNDQVSYIPFKNNKNEEQEINFPRWKSPNYNTILYYVVLTILVVPSIIPAIALNSTIIRLTTTFATAVLILMGSQVKLNILCIDPITYIGDISYILYLVHWPIITITRLFQTDVDIIWISQLVIAFFVSFLVAVIVHETFEKFYLGLTRKSSLVLTFALYASTMFLVRYSPHLLNVKHFDFNNVPSKIPIEEVIKINWQNDRNDTVNQHHDFCHYGDREVTSHHACRMSDLTGRNGSILILGNSYAANSVPALYKHCKDKVKQMRMYSVSACEVIYGTKRSWCTNKVNLDLDIVRKHKPDYLFVLVRHIQLLEDVTKSLTTREATAIHDKIAGNLARFSNHVEKKIYILHVMTTSKIYLTKLVNQHIAAHSPSEAYNSFKFVEKTRLVQARKILETAVAGCPKCAIIDYEKEFLGPNGLFQFFDPKNGLTYLNSFLHLTPHGLNKVDNLYEKICDNLGE